LGAHDDPWISLMNSPCLGWHPPKTIGMIPANSVAA